MSEKVTPRPATIPEMVALRDALDGLDRRPPRDDYADAVTAAETLAKALRVVAYRECEDIQESVTSDEGGVIITKQPCGECPPCEAAALLDELYQDWRAKKP